MKILTLLAAVASLTGCTLSVSPDGSRMWAAQPDAFLRAIEVIATK